MPLVILCSDASFDILTKADKTCSAKVDQEMKQDATLKLKLNFSVAPENICACGHPSKSEQNFSDHIKDAHKLITEDGKSCYSCVALIENDELCSHIAKSPSDLIKHIRAHTQPYVCPHSPGRTFSRLSRLDKHIELKHPQKTKKIKRKLSETSTDKQQKQVNSKRLRNTQSETAVCSESRPDAAGSQKNCLCSPSTFSSQYYASNDELFDSQLDREQLPETNSSSCEFYQEQQIIIPQSEKYIEQDQTNGTKKQPGKNQAQKKPQRSTKSLPLLSALSKNIKRQKGTKQESKGQDLYTFIDKPGKCSCNLSYENEQDFKKHLSEAHKNNPGFACKACTYICGDLSALKDHIRCKHTPEDKRYKCNNCEYRASLKRTVVQHVNRCTNPKQAHQIQHNCSCGHISSNYIEFKQHMKAEHEVIIGNEVRYICHAKLANNEYCQHTEQYISQIKRHMETPHTGNFACPHCLKAFPVLLRQIAHIKKFHPELAMGI